MMIQDIPFLNVFRIFHLFTILNITLSMSAYCKSETFLYCNCNGYYHNNKCICDKGYRGSFCDIIIKTTTITTTTTTTTTTITTTDTITTDTKTTKNLGNSSNASNYSNSSNSSNKIKDKENNKEDDSKILIIYGCFTLLVTIFLIIIDYLNICKI